MNAYQKANIFINMTYKEERGLNYDIAPCDYMPANMTHYGFPIKANCTCNTCYSDKLCVYDNDPKMNILEGFSVFKVLAVYVIVILVTLVIYFIKRNKKIESRSRASTFSESGGINQQNNDSTTNRPSVTLLDN